MTQPFKACPIPRKCDECERRPRNCVVVLLPGGARVTWLCKSHTKSFHAEFNAAIEQVKAKVADLPTETTTPEALSDADGVVHIPTPMSGPSINLDDLDLHEGVVAEHTQSD